MLSDLNIYLTCLIYNLGPQWALHSNWLSEKPVGQWYGVEVNKQGYVLKLKLINNNLTGSLPDDCLGNLRYLEKVKLYDNPHFKGAIPKDIGTLPLAYFRVDAPTFKLPENWLTMSGAEQALWITEHAVEPVAVRNYMLLR